MKLQVVELPEQRLGDAVETPFLLVFSEVESGPELFEGLAEEDRVRLREQIGARGFLAFEDPVEVLPRAAQ